MPGGDGTGPMGMGPMTGRAAGFCAGYGVPGYLNPIPGRGFGRGRGGWGRGGGRGWRHWFYATGLPGWQRAATGWPAWGAYAPPAAAGMVGPALTEEQEVEALNGQAKYLEDALKNIQKRIAELQASQQKASK